MGTITRLPRKVTPTGLLLAPVGLPEDEWLALRKTGLGGSDIAALLGMDRYTSARELYLEKRGELPDLPRSPRLEQAARWGHLHEPLIAAEFARQHNVRTRRVGLIRHQDEPWRLANLDRQVSGCPDGPCLLEIKNRSAWKTADWGESGDPDGVPDTEALQTHWYLSVTGYRHAHVAVLLNGNDDRYYRVDADKHLAADVLDMARGFWQRVQEGNPPPLDGSDSVAILLAGLWTGTEGSEMVLGPAEADDLLARRAAVTERQSELAAERAAVEHELKALLGDREIALRGGEPVYSWKRNGMFSAKRFREAHPDLAEKYTHLVPAIDTAALKAAHPDEYRASRARVLRITQETT